MSEIRKMESKTNTNTKTILTDDDAGDRDGHCNPQHNRAPN